MSAVHVIDPSLRAPEGAHVLRLSVAGARALSRRESEAFILDVGTETVCALRAEVYVVDQHGVVLLSMWPGPSQQIGGEGFAGVTLAADPAQVLANFQLRLGSFGELRSGS